MGRRFRLEIVRRFAKLMRVPFDPYRALWVWNDPSTFPRCSDAKLDASLRNPRQSADYIGGALGA